MTDLVSDSVVIVGRINPYLVADNPFALERRDANPCVDRSYRAVDG
jgi:hypothetical protein